jgi:hypothetical protein
MRGDEKISSQPHRNRYLPRGACSHRDHAPFSLWGAPGCKADSHFADPALRQALYFLMSVKPPA